jgi:hypothetical protein
MVLINQLLMEYQKLVLVVLQKLKVGFLRTQSIFASCTCIDNSSGNHGLFVDFCNYTMLSMLFYIESNAYSE